MTTAIIISILALTAILIWWFCTSKKEDTHPKEDAEARASRFLQKAIEKAIKEGMLLEDGTSPAPQSQPHPQPQPRKRPTTYPVLIKNTLPFVPNDREIIFIETSFSKNINQYIANNYAQLKEGFRSGGLDFIYLPKRIEEILKSGSSGSIQYMYPHLNMEDLKSGLLYAEQIEEIILNCIQNIETELTSGLICFNSKESFGDTYKFDYLPIPNDNPETIQELCKDYRPRSLYIEYCKPIMGAAPREPEDQDIPVEAHILMKEIRERIIALRKVGVDEMILKSLFSIENPFKLSRLIITKDFKIFLPDYNNLEIKLRPLPKSLYILYLKHPEGIMFKHLSDYKEELTSIYKRITNREYLWRVQKSINDITDPTKNTLNENCSRIKEAFVGKFDVHLASSYYITGNRATPKTITLDRELVIFEEMF